MNLIDSIKDGIERTDGKDNYSVGMRNGMKWTLSLVDGKEPQYDACEPTATKQEDKPKYSKGDKVKAIDGEYKGDCGTILEYLHDDVYKVQFPSGWYCKCECNLEPYTEPSKPSLIVTSDMLGKLNACAGGRNAFETNFPNGGELETVIAKANEIGRNGDAEWLDFRRDRIESMQNQPTKEKEAVTLYCIKDVAPYLTKGKLYETDKKSFLFDNGFNDTHCHFETDHFIGGLLLKDCLIEAVKRPAVVGEWILVTSDPTNDQHGDYRKGEIYCVERVCGTGKYVPKKDGKHPCSYENLYQLLDDEYLVLPSYQPEEKEPEKVEPVYWSGKVVCTEIPDSAYIPSNQKIEVGKVYSVENGCFVWPSGFKSQPEYHGVPGSDKEPFCMGVKFIEFKG